MTRTADPAKDAPPGGLAGVLANLAAIGRRLVETSESALALLREGEAECRGPAREPEAIQNPMLPSPTEKPSALMTRREVAALLRIDERTLARWRADPSTKFPEPVHRARVLRWRRISIERWLAAREP